MISTMPHDEMATGGTMQAHREFDANGHKDAWPNICGRWGKYMNKQNWLRVQKLAASLVLASGLSACAATVDYGKVPHAQYVANPACNPSGAITRLNADNRLFVATTRLPDCRTDQISLLNFRSNVMRFGRFDAAQDRSDAKGKMKKVVPLGFQSEASWWADLERQARANDGRVLVYVHGFRETFATSSDSTLQIARLAGFNGPVIQYSWPSQGELLGYAVDETNMYWDERNFRRFLQKLAQQPWMKEIGLVSHSMGARLVIPGVEWVDRNSASADSSNISNIVLVAPDVDRQDFERDIAEEVLAARRVNNGRRITVYVSAKDKALALSRTIHGYPRLGSPYCFDPFEAADLKAKGLPERCYAAKTVYDVPPERSGFTIIDTTGVSRGRTGHSDFLTSAQACRDFQAVMTGAAIPADLRKPTHLAHVFTLIDPPKDQRPGDKEACLIEK